MNRIDRLTAMILMLQGHRVVTAEQIAGHFEISVRTVYRDVAALGEAGVPVVAEAGVGYSLMRGYHMPPVMFTDKEAAALFMGGEMAGKFGDESLRESLRGALLKVRAVLPAERRDYLSRVGNSVGVWARPTGFEEGALLMPVQDAVAQRRCLMVHYDAGDRGVLTERVVEALGLVFYARHWHLIGWCRLRNAFRDFRLDRIKMYQVLDETFPGHEEFSLMDFVQEEVDECEMTPVTLVCECWALERLLSEMPAKLIGKSTDLPDDWVRVEANAYSVDWMASWLLGLGAAVEVIEPAILRKKIRDRAAAVVASYDEKVQDDETLLT